jgi:hypothetical protein
LTDASRFSQLSQTDDREMRNSDRGYGACFTRPSARIDE